MTFTVLRRRDHEDMPWRNGGGRTLEVARQPRTGELGWRVSFAHVDASGPFSAFPGVDRVITLVEGPAMRLALTPYAGPGAARPDDPGAARPVVHDLRPHEPFVFAGEDAVDCTVTRPTIDLNLMTRRDRWRGEVSCHPVGEAAGEELVVAPAGEGATTLVAVLAGAVTAREGAVPGGGVPDGSGAEATLGLLDVLAEPTGPVALTGRGAVAVLQVEPVAERPDAERPDAPEAAVR